MLFCGADLGAGVLGDVEQPADQLQHALFVHLADVGGLDDELPRELDLGLGARIGLDSRRSTGSASCPF